MASSAPATPPAPAPAQSTVTVPSIAGHMPGQLDVGNNVTTSDAASRGCDRRRPAIVGGCHLALGRQRSARDGTEAAKQTLVQAVPHALKAIDALYKLGSAPVGITYLFKALVPVHGTGDAKAPEYTYV